MDDVQEILSRPTLNRLLLFIYLVPGFGMVPALWTLTRPSSDRRHRAISRLALILGLTWALGFMGLNVSGSAMGENGTSVQMTMLLFNSLLTSGYFVVSLWLMVRLWKGKTSELPVLNAVTKHLP